MVTELRFKNAYRSQRSIYDERYQAGLYDQRSVVRVLTAEDDALHEAMDRVIKTNRATRRINWFDFGYGTGRVTNDFIGRYFHGYAAAKKDLRVVAYDVSSVGLRRAKDALCSYGFAQVGPMFWIPGRATGYIAGRVSRTTSGITVTVVFVHGNEGQGPDVMRRLALRASGREKYLLTTSWYSGLGHIPGEGLRREYFRQLGRLTSRHGEMVISASATGDLAELQPEFSERLANQITDGFPIEAPGDLVYTTELGQSNFYHVFGIDLNDHMKAITTGSQYWWMEGIRYPDEEFTSEEAERENNDQVRHANDCKRKRGGEWNADDYRQFHTVAAFRSPLDPRKR